MQATDIAIEPTPGLSAEKTAKLIAFQNDQFRKSTLGVPVEGPVPRGRIVMTPCVAQQTDEFRNALLAAVGAYDAFHPDSDPCGRHEMGVVDIEGQTVWFKVDLYDEDYEYGASDPTDPRFTRRVLTLLLLSEY